MSNKQNLFYKYKEPRHRFFCALCRAERAQYYSRKLDKKNFCQVFIISTLFAVVLYPYFKIRVFIIPFIIWFIFEFLAKMLYRKEIPCPHCGFDAIWYKRDIKVARKKVEDFWREQEEPTIIALQQEKQKEEQSVDLSKESSIVE